MNKLNIAGIVLWVVQIIAIIGILLGGRNPFGGGFLNILGVCIFGIVGTILFVVAAVKKSQTKNNDDDDK